jgi:hypothetical protein
MPRIIETTNGSSLFNATISLVKRIEVHTVNARSKSQQVISLKFGQTISGISFEEIIDAVKQSELLIVRQPSSSPYGKCFANSRRLKPLLNPKLNAGYQYVFVILFTDPLDKIRALAKELRTDKAVAKAAIKPIKPKADLKTRRDVI